MKSCFSKEDTPIRKTQTSVDVLDLVLVSYTSDR